MKYNKTVIEVKIRIDPIPGWMHDPDDHVKFLQDTLNSSIPHYRPEVRLIRVEREITNDKI